MRNAGYFRQPTVHGDTAVFVSEDDLWSVPLAGGVASRLTANIAAISNPALSRDGKTLAFTALEEHHPEVWVMPATGGAARRLTWLGANTTVSGWMPDGRVLAISDARAPMPRRSTAVAVDVASGDVQWMNVGKCSAMAWSTDGRRVALGRHTADPARWKRYRGGTAGQIWVDARGTGDYRPILTGLRGNLAAPMWIGDRLFFISDHEGIGNIYSCRASGNDVLRHTDHGEYYARHASTDGRTIVYAHAAELWRYDPATDTGARVEVDFPSPRAQRNRKFVAPERYLGGYAVHPKGHSLVVETRGKLFSFPMWERNVTQHGRADGVRYRLSRWGRDGKTVITISDETGEDTIELHEPGKVEAARRLEGLDIGVVHDIAVSPVADQLALTNQRNELLVVDLERGTSRLLDSSAFGGVDGATWSPDGRWLAYSCAMSEQTSAMKLCDTRNGKTYVVTRPDFRDYNPSWDPGGKYLYFLSSRIFDPVYDTLFFDLGFPRSSKPYALVLQRDELSPFVPVPKGLGDDAAAGKNDPKPEAAEDARKAAKAGENKETAPAPTVVDLEGIEDRAVEFPLAAANYHKIVGIRDKVLILSSGVEGTLTRNPPGTPEGPRRNLEMWDLKEGRSEMVVAGISWFEVSGDGSAMVYSADGRLRALPAGRKPPEGPDAEGPPGRRNGWIDLGRVRVSVDPAREWRQMYGEAWRLQREYFWVSDMSGVDWGRVYERYLPLIDKVASRAEFSDLMWEMQGELGTSHAYEFGGDYRPAPAYAMGYLGADLELDRKTGRWRVAHVVRGDQWDPERGSPLLAPGVNVREGDFILAVNGRPVGRQDSPAQQLVHQAGQQVELTVATGGKRGSRSVVVTALRGEAALRYREWVETNRARVHDASNGRVGYVHIPDMGAGGYAEFHREYLAEVVRDALVIDVRNNGGGHVSQILLEKLARKRIGYDVPRYGPISPYPSDSPAGPLVCITDENAGSDGDIFTHGFKLMKLGPVVGKRTWGGVIGISPQHQLVDGSITTQPQFSYWFADVGWGVENYGTDPDHEVDIRPQDAAAGRDPQLDRALQLVLRALRSYRPVRPGSKRPSLALPRLPPRGA